MKEQIRKHALQLGFDACGFATVRPLDHLKKFYDQFIKEERQASVGYLKRYAAERLHPDMVLPGGRTVIACLINYYPPELLVEEDNFIISKYAYGNDYPQLIKGKLHQLAAFIDTLTGQAVTSKVFSDSGPVLEKAWAQQCGVGWQGKNTILVNRKGGSFFFIGILLTTLETEPDLPETDHCGNCNKCISACPTGAIDRPYQLDIRKCISYCTLVKNAEMIPEVGSRLGGKIYGCDICQDACPYNRFALPTPETYFHPSDALKKMRKNDWIHLTEEQYELWFSGKALGDIGYQRLMKNIHNAITP